jgi:hypothetical protein
MCLSIIVILYKEVDRFTETYEAYTKLRDFAADKSPVWKPIPDYEGII